MLLYFGLFWSEHGINVIEIFIFSYANVKFCLFSNASWTPLLECLSVMSKKFQGFAEVHLWLERLGLLTLAFLVKYFGGKKNREDILGVRRVAGKFHYLGISLLWPSLYLNTVFFKHILYILKRNKNIH